MDKNNSLPIHTLLGDETENFYQLGLHDRQRHTLLLDHAKGLFRSRRAPLNQTIQKIIQAGVAPSLEFYPRFKRRITAYAEGLQKNPSEVAMGLLIPEMMCFMDKWIPGIPHTLLGCSSAFVWCTKRDALVHGRTLDFPFHGSFDVHERAIQSQLNDGPMTLSFSSAGFPFPSITAMSEAGYTLGLHQKFSRTFHYQGTPIFDLIFEMLQNCDSLEEVVRFLKKSESLTAWSLYMGFQDGRVLSFEIDGDQHYHSIHQATEDKPLYFCNQRENKKLISHEIMPYGFELYNEMRLEMRHKKLKALGLSRKKKWDAESLMRFIGVADEQSQTESSLYKADPMTPSALQNIVMVPQAQEALVVTGLGPKFFSGKVQKISDTFDRVRQETITIKGKVNEPRFRKGNYHFMQAQVAQDRGEIHKTYHHIQLAIEYLQDYPMGVIAKFYFLVFQYMHEEHKKVLSVLLGEFKKLEGKLPPYLQDHNTLFLSRLEKILKGQISAGIDEIKHPSLQRVFEFEKKMPRLLFHAVTKELMAPRLDLLDIFYPHIKASR
ncbi:MAG: hypothetical protein VXV96_06825 [Bdellovibrionota bacterium]|nr:hypothetical protein [Bdellovibrionota bacterium]